MENDEDYCNSGAHLKKPAVSVRWKEGRILYNLKTFEGVLGVGTT